jgi:hypothetical protein
MSSPSALKDGKSRWRPLARRVLAGSIVFALAALGFASNYVMSLRICRQTISSQGKILSLCEPYGISDLAVGLPMVIVLLLPDLAEVELPGIGAMRLRLRERGDQAQHRQPASSPLGEQTPLVVAHRGTDTAAREASASEDPAAISRNHSAAMRATPSL